MIYRKINRLTSMVYPEYKSLDNLGQFTNSDGDPNDVPDNRFRMKPPLCQLRLGDLFGRFATVAAGSSPDKNLVTGFIKTLSYSFPDEGPWEIEAGKRVPKYIQVELGFQVIHATVPNLQLAVSDATDPRQTGARGSFYGITQTIWDKENYPGV